MHTGLGHTASLSCIVSADPPATVRYSTVQYSTVQYMTFMKLQSTCTAIIQVTRAGDPLDFCFSLAILLKWINNALTVFCCGEVTLYLKTLKTLKTLYYIVCRWYRSSLLLESDNNYLIESKGTLHTFIIRTVARYDLHSISILKIILFPSCLKFKNDYLKGWDKRIKALDDVLPFPELHNINFGK